MYMGVNIQKVYVTYIGIHLHKESTPKCEHKQLARTSWGRGRHVGKSPFPVFSEGGSGTSEEWPSGVAGLRPAHAAGTV